MAALAVILAAADCRPQGSAGPSDPSSAAPTASGAVAEPTATGAAVVDRGGFSVGLEYGVPGLASSSAVIGAPPANSSSVTPTASPP